jgi:hypothetical protein
METLRMLSFLLLFAMPALAFSQEEEHLEEAEDAVTTDEFSLPTPSAGKAIVIFTRPVLDAPIVQFKYFCNDIYLGKIGVGSYLVYECDPGKYLFWADSETINVVKAELAADRVYIFDTFVQKGAFQARLTLTPFDPESKRADRKRQSLITQISKKTAKRFDPDEQPGKSLQRTANNVMKKYTVEPTEEDNKRWSKVTVMNADQYIQ